MHGVEPRDDPQPAGTRHYDYAVVRVVPRVEREEFVNVGVILSCESSRYLEARIELDEGRVLALAPDLDLDSLRRHLENGNPLDGREDWRTMADTLANCLHCMASEMRNFLAGKAGQDHLRSP